MSPNLPGLTNFTDRQIEILARRAISPETALVAGVASVIVASDLPAGCPDYWTEEAGYLPGLLFNYCSPITGEVVPQLRPDEPVVSTDGGSVAKYVFAKGAASVLHLARTWPAAETELVLITEGTCQTIAAAAYAPDGVAVYGIAGCQSWMKHGVPTADLAVVNGHPVLIALDADAGTNRAVYDAGVSLREAALAAGAESVRFLRVPGGNKSGLDDVLGGQGESERSAYLGRLIHRWLEAPLGDGPTKPASTKPKPRASDTAGEDGGASRWIVEGELQVRTLSEAIQERTPVALTAEQRVAVYQGGVFKVDDLAFAYEVTELLGERFRNGHLSNVETFTAAQLSGAGYKLPDHTAEPIMNAANCMVDLRTGRTMPHAPSFASSVQFPIEWIPDAKAPVYERWLRDQAGDQVDDLEESVATMLDPSMTPEKAIFLFGPARSGKGTMLRLITAIAGTDNTSGVDLAALSSNKFAAANVYGKALNVSGDLPAMHVDDVSMFKKLTGEDLIQADRKYGKQFPFTNKALFVFAANELPTVGESSRAYVERFKPFGFNASFAGRVDRSIEQRMMQELPGILVRWVAAYQRRLARGYDLAGSPVVRERFEIASDRVRQFLTARCRVGEGFTTTTDLHRAFKEWATDSGGSVLGKIKFAERLRIAPGVEPRVNSAKTRGWSTVLLPREQWDKGEHGDDVPESASLDTEQGVELQSPPILTIFESGITSGLNDLETYTAPNSGGVLETISATLPPVRESASLSTSPIDSLFAELGDSEAHTCTECGTPEALVDSTWLACPRCYPATARVLLTHPTKDED